MDSLALIRDRVLQAEQQRTDRSSPFILAIDGRSASGKTTLALHLAELLPASVIHMDDFFLPPELRTEERYARPGGNVHQERFVREVLPFLRKKDAFSYRRFDCRTMAYGEDIAVGCTPFRIIEGAYSLHPDFGRYADLTVFVSVSPEAQMERIIKRNGDTMAQRFREKWIPLEEAYFSAFSVVQTADLVIEND